MIKIHLYTGNGDTRFIMVNVDYDEDKNVIDLIEDYYDENGKLPVKTMTDEEFNNYVDRVHNGELKSSHLTLADMLYVKDFWIPGIHKVETLGD